MAIGRRQFLALGAGTGAATWLGTTVQASAAAPERVLVWRLSSDWGFPMPPRGRTRCRCAACHANASNKVYASQADAIAGRIHPHCSCIPVAIDMLAPDVAQLFPTSTPAGSIDLRAAGVRPLYESAVIRARQTTTPTTPTTPTTSTPDPVPAPEVIPTTTALPTPTSPATSPAIVGPVVVTFPGVATTTSPDATAPGTAMWLPPAGLALPVGAPAIADTSDQSAQLPMGATEPTTTALPVTGSSAETVLVAATVLIGAGALIGAFNARPEA